MVRPSAASRLNLSIILDTRNAEAILRAFDNRIKIFKGSVDSLGLSGKETQQAMSNLVSGLHIVNTSASQMTQAISKFRRQTIDSFKESEAAIAGIEIAMGRVGDLLKTTGSSDNNLAQELAVESKAIQKEVDRLSGSTEFTFTEVARLFQTLKQAGLSTQKITEGNNESILQMALSLTSASGGVLTLEESATTLLQSANSMGGGLNNISKNADMMIRAINRADLSFRDLQIIMASLGGVQKSLLKNTDPEQILALVAALKTSGRSAAEAALDVKGFGRSLLQLVGDINGKVMRSTKGLITSGAGRFSKKLFALNILGMTKEDLVNEAGELRSVLDIYNNIQDRLKKLSQGGVRFQARGKISDTRDAQAQLAAMGFDLKGTESGRSIIEVRRGGIKEADVKALIKTAFGGMQPVSIINAIELFEDRQRELYEDRALNIKQFATDISKTNGEVVASHNRRLETLQMQEKLQESALFLLEKNIGEATGAFERIKVQSQTKVLNFLNEILDQEPGMKEFAGTTLILVENLSKMVAVLSLAAFSAFGVGQIVTAAGIGAGSFFGTVAVMLEGLLAMAMPFVAAIGAIATVVYGLNRAIGRLLGSTATLADQQSSVLLGLRDIALNFSEVILPLILGQELTKEQTQRFKDMNKVARLAVHGIARVFGFIKEFFLGIVAGISFAMETIILVIDEIISGIFKILAPLELVTGNLDDLQTSIKENGKMLRFVGVALGAIIGPMLIFGAITKVASVAVLLFSTVTKTATVTLMIFGKTSKILTAISYAFSTAMVVGEYVLLLFTKASFGAQASLSSLILPMIAVIALVYGAYKAFSALVGGFYAAYKAGNTLSMVLYGLGAVVMGVLLAGLTAVAIGFIKVAASAALAAIGGMTFLLPVLVAIGALALLAAAIYKVGQYFSWWGDSAEKAAQGTDKATASAKGLAESAGLELDDESSASSNKTLLQKTMATAGLEGMDASSLGKSLLGGNLGASLPEGLSAATPKGTGTAGLPAVAAAPKDIKINLTLNSSVPASDQQMREAAERIIPHIKRALAFNQGL